MLKGGFFIGNGSGSESNEPIDAYTKTESDNKFATKIDLDSKSDTGHSHSYNELTDKPIIPSKTSDLDNDSGFVDGSYDNSISGLESTTVKDAIDELQSSKSNSGHSHSYNELTDKPIIPSNVSQLLNDSGFINGEYDNSNSGLTATTFQDAIDEIKSIIDNLNQ